MQGPEGDQSGALERESVRVVLANLGLIPEDTTSSSSSSLALLDHAMLYFNSTPCGKNIAALQKEFTRRANKGKCLLLTQTAKPQAQYFRACLEGTLAEDPITPAHGTAAPLVPSAEDDAAGESVAEYLLVDDGGPMRVMHDKQPEVGEEKEGNQRLAKRKVISTSKIFRDSGLQPGVDYDDVALFANPSYEAVEHHISESRPLEEFVSRHILDCGYKEVVAVVTGSDGSAALCDAVNAAIGQGDFVSNDPSEEFFVEARRDKVKMHEALRRYADSQATTSSSSSSTSPVDFLYIRSVSATSFLDASSKIAAAGLRFPLIAKPATGAGSEFIHLCFTLGDVETAFKVTSGLTTTQHTSTEVMCVQEYIDGDEFVVNCVSYNGIHVVTDCWESVKNPMQVRSDRMRFSEREKQKKMINNSNNPAAGNRNGQQESVSAPRPELDTITIVYDRLKFIPCITVPGSRIRRIVDYTLKCLDALHVRNGCTHSELRFDDSRGGPCLIEMNPRMQGDVPRATAFVGYDQVSLLCYLIRIGKARLEEAVRDGRLAAKYWPPRRWVRHIASNLAHDDQPSGQPMPLLYRPLVRSDTQRDNAGSRSIEGGELEGCGGSDDSMRNDQGSSLTALVIFLLVRHDGVVCDWGRQYIQTQLKTFSRYTRSLLRQPAANMVNLCHKTTDIFSCPGAVILIGTSTDVEQDAATIRRMENDVLTDSRCVTRFARARLVRQEWRRAIWEKQEFDRSRHRDDAAGDASTDGQGGGGGGTDSPDPVGFQSDDEQTAAEAQRMEMRVALLEQRQEDERNAALTAFRQLQPPPLFISRTEWEAVRDSGCGEVCASDWWLSGNHLPTS
jgi:hypothetical protein